MKKIKPKKGQESVWDYPRPPRMEKTNKRLVVKIGNDVIAETSRGYRVLETSHPPVYYFPPEDVRMEKLQKDAQKRTYCEFKGAAEYWKWTGDAEKDHTIAWSYPNPNKTYAAIKDHLAFYPSRVDECYVNDERVKAQEGDFYGGWITSDIVGPFKGGAGTWGW